MPRTETGLNTETTSTDNSNWTAKILFGEAVNVDEFEGGGHDRSAKALADGIRQLSERTEERRRTGGAIGLEGTWGSGKSTVIEIASSKHLSADYIVFNFDIWRHHSDNFRRALLEQFIVFVRDKFNPQGKDGKNLYETSDPRQTVDLNIDDKYDEIRNRKSITTKSSKRRITLFGTILAILLPLMPLAYSVGGNTINKAKSPNLEIGDLTISPALFWSLVLIAFYAIAATVLLIFASRSRQFNDKSNFNGRTAWLRGGASHLLNLSERDQNNEITQTIRDENPTTVEFRTVFEAILEPLQKTGKRVVFVLDNIDRIPTSELPSIWAEIRSLIAGNGTSPSKAVVAVIPYDRDHVSEAFPPPKSPKLVTGGNGRRRIERANEQMSETDVFEKTFDRVVKVSAPLPSSWKRFLLDRVEKAAFSGDHTIDYSEKLFRLLRYQFEIEGVYPTPRRIISFVNEIGGLWVQWSASTIPIETVGLYVLHRHHFDCDPSLLSLASPIEERFVRIVDDPDYAKHLAALAFNVEPELADQVRLGIPITSALLEKDDTEALTQLAQGVGFDEIFQEVLRSQLAEWAVDSPQLIAQAATNVEKLELSPETEPVIWQIFADNLGRSGGWSYQHITLPGLYTIVTRQKRATPEIIANIIRQKIENIPSTGRESDEYQRGKLWHEMLKQLTTAVTYAAGRERGETYWKSTIPVRPPGFTIGVISNHDLKNDLAFSELEFGTPLSELSAAISELAERDPITYEHCIEVLDWRLEEHVDAQLGAIAALLSANSPDERTTPLIRASIKILMYTPASNFRDAFASINDRELLAHAKWQEDYGSETDLADGILLAVTANNGSLVTTNNITEGQWYNDIINDGKKLSELQLQAIAASVINAGETSNWIKLAASLTAPDGGLYHHVLREIAKAPEVRNINLQVLIASIERLSNIIGIQGIDFLIQNCNVSDKAIEKNYAQEKILGLPNVAIEAFGRLRNLELSNRILQLVDDYLLNLTSTEWQQALLKKKDERRRLLVARQAAGGITLSTNFVQGLVSVSVEVLEGKFDPATIHEEWKDIFAAIPLSQFTTLRKQIASKMLTADVTSAGALAFVAIFSKISQKMKFSESASAADRALTHFLWFLASSNGETARSYLAENKIEIDDTLKAASSDDIRAAFEEVWKENQSQ